MYMNHCKIPYTIIKRLYPNIEIYQPVEPNILCQR
jgi:hypothetical protein